MLIRHVYNTPINIDLGIAGKVWSTHDTTARVSTSVVCLFFYENFV